MSIFIAGALGLCGLGGVRFCCVPPLVANDWARVGRIAPAISFIDAEAVGDTAFYVGL